MRRPRSPVAQINHIVVLMLENRSFDHLLGFLYKANGNVSPLGQPFEGLTGRETNPDGKGGSVPVFAIEPSHAHPYFMPGANPGEGYLNTNSQLFGENKAPDPIVPAMNNGFVSNFAYTLSWETKEEPSSVIPGTQFGDVLSLSQPRTDDPLAGIAVPVSAAKVAPPSHPDKFQLALAQYAAALPIVEIAAGYHAAAPDFQTGDQAIAYARERYRLYAQQRSRTPTAREGL